MTLGNVMVVCDIGVVTRECDNVVVVAYICVDHLICTYTAPPTHSIEITNIRQPKSTDIVITTPGALGRWSHTDQFFFANSDQNSLLTTDLLNSSDQKFFTRKIKFSLLAIQIRNPSINSFKNSSNTTTSPAVDVILTAKDYCQINIDTFQEYATGDFEGKHLWGAIKIDFKLWTKEDWKAIDATTWMIVEQYCIPRGVWIDHYKNKNTQSEILMKKIVLATKYDIDLSDWDMNRIKQVEKTYGKVSRVI